MSSDEVELQTYQSNADVLDDILQECVEGIPDEIPDPPPLPPQATLIKLRRPQQP